MAGWPHRPTQTDLAKRWTQIKGYGPLRMSKTRARNGSRALKYIRTVRDFV